MVRRPQKPPVIYARRPRQKRKRDILNTLTALLLFLSFCLISWFFYIYNFPNSIVNPLPPHNATPITDQDLPDSELTPSSTPGQATETTTAPTGTATTAAETAIPITATTNSAQLTSVPVSNTLAPSLTVTSETNLQSGTTVPHSVFSYAVIGVTPVNSIAAAQLNPGRDCNWMGVGGYVNTIQNSPAQGIIVQLGGKLNRSGVAITAVSGMATQYGPAGFEFTLANKPEASSHSLWLRLLDQSRQPISDQVYFDTYDDCQHNLTLINFKQIK